jgi:hypothetical protein
MNKFAEQAGLFKKEQPKKVELAANEEPCEGCPDGKKTKETATEKKPFAVLKVDGKDVPIESEEKLKELAQKGFDYTKKTQLTSAERSELEKRAKELEERERKIDRVQSQVEELIGLIKQRPEGQREETQEPSDEEIALDQLDPSTRKLIKDQKDRITKLETEMGATATERQQRQLESLKSGLEKIYADATKEYPIEEILDENGENLTHDTVAGVLSVLVNKDAMRKKADPSFELKSIDAYIKDSIKIVSRILGQGKTNNKNQASAKISLDDFIKSSPKEIDEFKQQIIAEYLAAQSSMPPNAKSLRDEVKPRTDEKQGKFKGLDDAMKAAFQDKELVEGLQEIKKARLRA